MNTAYLAALHSADQDVNPLFNFLGARMREAVDGKAVIELPVSMQLVQGGGVVAGGILATLADEAMAHAVISILEDGCRTTTTEMNIRFLRSVNPQHKGTLRGVAKVVKSGRSVITAEAAVYDETGRLVATAGGSFFVMEEKPPRP